MDEEIDDLSFEIAQENNEDIEVIDLMNQNLQYRKMSKIPQLWVD